MSKKDDMKQALQMLNNATPAQREYVLDILHAFEFARREYIHMLKKHKEETRRIR